MTTRTLLTLGTMLTVMGCSTDRPPVPIPVPPIPAIVIEGEAMERDASTTILPGQGPPPIVPPGSVTTVATGSIRLNFPSADVGVVAKAVLGDLLRIRYSIAPGVTQKISLVTPGGVARSSLLGLFETSLKAAGLALTPVADGFQIQPVGSAGGPGGPETIGYATEIIQLQFVNADEVKRLLDSVVPGVVTATDPGRNALTIAGTTGQRRSARELLKQFDVNWLRNMSFGLFVPQRTDSRLIAPELEKLINAPDAPTRGLVRLITMERLNGVLAISAQPQYLEDVRRWVDILDREGQSAEPRLFVYRVQNGRARDLSRTLNAAFGNGGGDTGSANQDPFADPLRTAAPGETPQPRTTPVSGARSDPAAPGSTVGGDAAATSSSGRQLQSRITSDDVNNAVIVYGTPKEYAIVEDALRKLDIPPLQVLIEAAITEVSLTDDLRFGVQWNFQPGDTNFALTDGASTVPQQSGPGFSFFYSNSNDIRVTLNALEQRTNIKVVSAPKLLVLNNQTAALQVGDQVPIQTQQQQSVDSTVGAIVNSIEYRDTGVILKVTPRVNSGGLVLLDIAQEVSDVKATTTGVNSSPTISTRRISTSIAAQDGQVIALGGLFRDSKTFGKNGLPILSRIPVLGSLLFGNTRNMQNRTELIVILKAHVIRSAQDSRNITEELRAKLRTLEPFKTEGRIP